MNVLRAISEADEIICASYTACLEPRAKPRGGIEWQACIYRDGEEVMASEFGTITEASLASMSMLQTINMKLMDEAEQRLAEEDAERVWDPKEIADEPGFAGAIRKAI